ncbi:glycosyltransferase family 2 protein [Desulfobacula sp.]|uniref:glycosyltransferase family 2 protein n=1 Tax=Desulfobacula sp. TaxID=2593537 RepID=UPI00261250B8|nr:glycosyltransferase family 2 protein [Desulfobacula sp.]
MNTSVRTAALILNWNKKETVLKLLADIKNVSDCRADIFVVDNASTDGSAKAIQEAYPDVTILHNKKNLGGTGGFNSGLFHIIQKERYEYIWLLDNDIRVTNNTLNELEMIMNADEGIGIAGSRIQDIDQPEVTVETGANVRWDMMGVVPVNRNSTENLNGIIDVDYVAICSALVRISALKITGLMDDRFFLCWDDMDWGQYFIKNGYRVVAVCQSIVFHGSFTERDRGDLSNYYYGIRNAFLFYSKHVPDNKRIILFYNSLRFYLKLYFFYRFHAHRLKAGLIKQAVQDFYFSRWGKIQEYCNGKKKRFSEDEHLYLLNPEKILIPLIGTSYQNSMNLLSDIKIRYPGASMHIIITRDRKNYFKEYSKTLIDNRMLSRVSYLLEQLAKLHKKKFDVVAAALPTPFIYAAPKVMFYDEQTRLFSVIRLGRLKCHRIIGSNLLGEIFSILVFPYIYYQSLVYKSGKK